MVSQPEAVPEEADLPAAAFYERLGPSAYRSTAATQSPWDLDFQHGGPPAALLAKAVEESVGDDPMVIGKVEVDFLAPIPQGDATIAVDVLRPGRRVRQVQASLSFGGRVSVLARAWLFGVQDGLTERVGTDVAGLPALPGPQPQHYFEGVAPSWGYGRAIEWRFADGVSGFGAAGAARVWTRVRLPLVAGEPITDLERLLVVSDSTNGLSAALPFDRWLFVPPSLTVAVLRPPSGEWFHVDARSSIEGQGTGLARSVIADQDGLCAEVLQPLLVAPR